MSRRANGEGSIYPYRKGFAAHVWIVTPMGRRQRTVHLGQRGRRKATVNDHGVEVDDRDRAELGQHDRVDDRRAEATHVGDRGLGQASHLGVATGGYPVDALAACASLARAQADCLPLAPGI